MDKATPAAILQPKYIINIGSLVLPQPADRGVPSPPVKVLRNVWLRLAEGHVAEIGPEGVSRPANIPDLELFDAGFALVTPGFVDAHTHPVFVDWRQGEFVRRCRGETYQQIAAAGGGILSSVRAVRASSEEMLAEWTYEHLRGFIAAGITSLEGKSGYGLTVNDELKSLAALKSAAGMAGMEVSPTLLGAHTIPPEFRDAPDRYVALVCNEMIPLAADGELADAVDVFLEEGAYNLEQARRVFEAGSKAGLGLRIHADQFTASGGAQLAAEFGALTADHMDQTDEAGLRMLAEAGVTVTLLPGAVFFLGLDKYADARRMLDLGCRVALSTDFNPGSSPTQSMPFMLTLACLKMKLSPEEAFWAATMGGAYAMNRQAMLGSLLPGYRADFCVWDAPDVAYLAYRYADLKPCEVFINGERWNGDGQGVAEA